MKRFMILMVGLIFCFCLTACDEVDQSSGNYFDDFEVGEVENTYEASGNADIENRVTLVYAAPEEDTHIHVKGELKSISGRVQLVYVNPKGDETVIADSKTDNKESMKINAGVSLAKGQGLIEFKGDHAKVRFKLQFTDSDGKKLDFIGTDMEQVKQAMEKTQPGETDKTLAGTDKTLAGTDETMTDTQGESLSAQPLPQKATVICNDDDKDRTVLRVKVSGDTKVRLEGSMEVTARDIKKTTKFEGFNLLFKTESKDVVNAFKYEEDVFASGGYLEIESFHADLILPAGTNELILSNNEGGTNYKLKVYVKVEAAK